jgi:hypothetical protein
MKTPILGSAYVARSVNAADARMVNLFPEIVPEAGKEPAFLNRAPGLRLLTTVGTGPIRGVRTVGTDLYVVSGRYLYKVTTSYVATQLGLVTDASTPVSMSDNGTQVVIACDGPMFVYNTITNVFAQVTDPDFPGALTVSFLDGYFVFIEPSSQKVWVTELNDPLSVDPLDFASAEADPDNLVSSIVDHGQVWLFGTNSVEVWYNSGNADFPLQPIDGAFNEIGCAATFSVAKLDNSLFWLGSDRRGKGIIYRANGYSGTRVSTHAIEWQIQQYPDISDAVAYTYQQDGHSFYVLSFPSGNATWVYDAATQAWHERAGWNNGAFTRHRSNCQTYFNNVNAVGDYQNGNIYAFDLDKYSDHDRIQKWLRSWRALPTGQNNLKRTAQHSLQLDLETGVGLAGDDPLVPFPPEEPTLYLDFVNQQYNIYTPNFVQGSNPQVMLRWSDDGGHTWSNENWISIGKIGEYYRRAIWRRLGMTLKLRDRVYEVSGTDPVKIAIMGAELIVSPTNA